MFNSIDSGYLELVKEVYDVQLSISLTPEFKLGEKTSQVIVDFADLKSQTIVEVVNITNTKQRRDIAQHLHTIRDFAGKNGFGKGFALRIVFQEELKSSDKKYFEKEFPSDTNHLHDRNTIFKIAENHNIDSSKFLSIPNDEYADTTDSSIDKISETNNKNLKHALSTNENDPVLSKKGYHNQGKIGYLLKERIGDSVPLQQVLLDENGVADYFAYINEEEENLNQFPISEKKVLGYINHSEGKHVKFYRYLRKNLDSEFDHFYCTSPKTDLLLKYKYRGENSKGFDSSFVLHDEIKNSTALYVYSNSLGVKLFSTLTIKEAPPRIEEINKLIQSKIESNSKFWWLHARVDKWKIDNLEIGQTESYGISDSSGRTQKYFRDTKIGDIVIGYQGAPDKRIKGIFEVSERDLVNKISFKNLYKLENQTKLEELRKISEFAESAINKARVGSLHPLSSELFQEIIKTTELESGQIKKGTLKSSESKIANITRDADKGTDYLDIRKDVTAFAKVIASSNFSPPLAIALFGQWGTGKSFFMEKLRDKIDSLSKQNSDIYQSGIAQIHFNAWSYLDTNLFASFVSEVFEKLDEYITGNKKADVHKRNIENELTSKLAIAKEHQSELRNKKLQDIKTIRELRGKIIQAKTDLDLKTNEIKSNTFKKAITEADKDFNVNDQLKVALSDVSITGLSLSDLNPKSTLDELKSTKSFVLQFLDFAKKDKLNLFILFVILILVIGLSFIAKPGFSYDIKIPQAVISLLAPVPLIWSNIKSTIKFLSPIISKVTAIRDEYQNQIDLVQSKYRQIEIASKIEIDSKTIEIENLHTEILSLENDIDDINYMLKNNIKQRAIYSYINARSQSEDYQKHLGIVSVIRKDFETLSDLFDKTKPENENFRNQFKNPLERIVLYIDDLDRCKEDRVIQVLEAVNLLMAFPLFVVVVGVDPRWVKNALLKQYHSQFNGVENGKEIGLEHINPSDYLEKIFQVPFHLEQASDSAVKTMLTQLSSQSVAEDNKDDDQIDEPEENDHEEENDQPEKKKVPKEDEPTAKEESKEDEHLYLKPREIELIPDMSQVLGTNPRAIKRFVNIYQILRAHENLEINHDIDDDYLVLMFLLALPIGDYRELNNRFVGYIAQPKNQKSKLDKFLTDSMSNDNGENKERVLLESRLKQLDSHKKLREMPISMFAEQNKFIQRFTFSELAQCLTTQIQPIKTEQNSQSSLRKARRGNKALKLT